MDSTHSFCNQPLQRDKPKEKEVEHIAAWLAELRCRLDDLLEQMSDVENPQDFCGVRFEHWMDRYIDLSEQVQLLEQFLREQEGMQDA